MPINTRSNDCIPAQGFDTNVVRLNRANGDFSSTFVNFMIHTTFMNRSGNDEATQSLGVAAGYDAQFSPQFKGALSTDQRALYGSWRVHAFAEGMQRFFTNCPDSGWRKNNSLTTRLGCPFAGRARISLEGERAPEVSGTLARRITPAILPYRWSVEISHSMNALLGAGPFIRWHDGQDYLNIGFVTRRKVFMWGLMLDMSGVDRIGAKLAQH